MRNITPSSVSPDEYAAKRQYFAGNAIGGYPFVGTPDEVAQQLAGLSKAGLRGIAVSFVDYLGEHIFLR
jgi:alkanesulfonate monooxygenase SsuD/methylene tetrahydromethanopterin reductase-like flavin-dependent oxidoreductase (luciferase family)